MDPWANIERTPDDPEIAAIDRMESGLGPLPEAVRGIRELITRFEPCHFKTLRHFALIEESIRALSPSVDPGRIGAAHPRHGGGSWKSDATGRSLLGLRYAAVLREWLGEAGPEDPGILPHPEVLEMGRRAGEWLGDRTPGKERLVRMLLSRLRWESADPFRSPGGTNGLERRIEATDICHPSFPRNLEGVVRSIGRMEPIGPFEGCGSVDDSVRRALEDGFDGLCARLAAAADPVRGRPDPEEAWRGWLTACLAKTVKSDLGLARPIPLPRGAPGPGPPGVSGD